MENITDEELIRKYLLGNITQSEKEEVEDRLFLDSDFLNHLLIVETELKNDYLFDELTPDQRIRFEEYFLRAPERQHALSVSRQLKEFASLPADKPVIAAGRIRQKVGWKWMFLNPRFAVSAIMIIFSVVLLWLLKDRQNLKSRVAELRPQQDSHQIQQEYADSAQQQLEKEQAENQKLRKHIQDEQQKLSLLKAQVELMEKNRASQSLRIARQKRKRIDNSEQLIGMNKPAELWPDQTRGAGKSNIVRIGPQAKEVLLQLNLEEDKYARYIVEIRNADNEKIWSKAGINARKISGDKALIVKVPARILTIGDYIMMVRGVNAGERLARIASYQFKVEKK
jgi:hypothetical protein